MFGLVGLCSFGVVRDLLFVTSDVWFLCVSLISIALLDCCFGLVACGLLLLLVVVNSVVVSLLSLSHALCVVLFVGFVISSMCCLLVYFGCS